jgi:hypothetical protein
MAVGGAILRKGWIGALAVMTLLAGCGASQHVSSPKSHPAVTKKKTGPATAKAKAPNTLYSAFAVTIDNQPAAWPQSGLSKADVVFEFMAEGGITRYLAVFWHQSAAKIGPVRSTRIYFDNVAAAYGWPLAHAGGNVDALKAIGTLGIKNLDQIYGSSPWFWRSTDRQMPHNLYTSTNLAEQGIQKDGYSPAGIPSFPQGKLTGTATASTLISYANLPNIWVYQVGWVWQNGLYQRQIDGNNVFTQAGNKVTAENVVIAMVPQFSDPDPYTPGAVNYNLTGGGKGYIMSQGVRRDITWTFGQGGFHFYLANGKAAPFAAGQTWIEMVPLGTPVTFQAGA